MQHRPDLMAHKMKQKTFYSLNWVGIKLEAGRAPLRPRRHRVTVGFFAVVVRQEPAFRLNQHNSIHSSL